MRAVIIKRGKTCPNRKYEKSAGGGGNNYHNKRSCFTKMQYTSHKKNETSQGLAGCAFTAQPVRLFFFFFFAVH